MKILLTFLAWLLLASSPAGATSLTLTGAGKPSSGGGCAEYTALAARMDGTQNTSAVQTLICGMVTDGTYSLIDVMYVFATSDATNALLNWAPSATYNTAVTGTETFAANRGYTGNGSTGYFSSGFNPSTAGGNFTRNSSSIGSCQLDARTSATPDTSVGLEIGSSSTFLQPYATASLTGTQYDLNGATYPGLAASNAQGSMIVSRTSSSALALYINGTSVATPSDTSQALANGIIAVGADQKATVSNFSTDQIAYAFWGAGLTATQAGNVYSRLHTYLTTVGASGC